MTVTIELPACFILHTVRGGYVLQLVISVQPLYNKVQGILPLDVDSINENDSVANPDPTPRIASAHKSRFVEVVLVECWMEAVYYCLLLRKQ